MRRSETSRRSSEETSSSDTVPLSTPSPSRIQSSGKRAEPRRLTAEDVTGFIDSAKKLHAQRKPSAVMAEIEREHPVRVAGLRSAYKWLQKQLKKKGINPEEARWML